MSLQNRLSDLIAAIGADIKTIMSLVTPRSAYLSTDYQTNSTTLSNPSSAFNISNLAAGTYQFSVDGAFSVADLLTKPTMGFSGSKISVAGIKYDFQTNLSAISESWSSGLNPVTSPALATLANLPFGFRASGVVVVTANGGNLSFQVASSSGSLVTIKAGTVMLLTRLS